MSLSWTFRIISPALAAVLFLLCGCRKPEPPSPKPKVEWRSLGSWSGNGNIQTESLNLEIPEWRIRWETKNPHSKEDATFKVELHSAISGRTLSVPVDEHGGPDHDFAYITEIPHLFYLSIESKNVDWTVTAEEPVLAKPAEKANPKD